MLALGQIGVANAADPSAQPQTTPTPPPTLPSGTLTVSPPIVSLTAPAGGTVSADVRLQSGIAQTVTIEPEGLGQASDGSFTYLSASSDKSPYSARSMASVSPGTLTMQPGVEQKVTVTVTVPQSAGDGIRYAIVRIAGTQGAASSDQVGIAVELGVPVLVTIAKTPLNRTGKLVNVAVSQGNAGSDVVTGQVSNTGNAHFGGAPNPLHVGATVYDANNHSVASARFDFTGNSILPSFTRDFSIDLGKSLDSGHYRVDVVAALQDNTIVDKSGMTFDISNGAVEGATAVPYQGPSGNGSGSEGSLIVMAVLGGALGGGLLVALVILAGRRGRAGAHA